jgi:hypothetical protein
VDLRSFGIERAGKFGITEDPYEFVADLPEFLLGVLPVGTSFRTRPA